MTSKWSFEGKRVAIVGCFSGMGEACARELVALGAEVHGADIRQSPVSLASFTKLDLKDWSGIDKTVKSIGGEIDALFNCAGLPPTHPGSDVLRVNFMGTRHWTEQWLPHMRKGGAIASISSLAGMGWLQKMALLQEFLSINDEQAMLSWCNTRPELLADAYSFSKELLNAWTQIEAVRQAKHGIRINATMPSPVETPMYKDFKQVAGEKIINAFTAPTYRFSSAAEQADPLIFLNSTAASFVSGVCLPVDHGLFGGVLTGKINLQALMAG